MKVSLSEKNLLILNFAAIRCLIANGILSKDDITADLARQGIDTAFRLVTAVREMPEQ